MKLVAAHEEMLRKLCIIDDVRERLAAMVEQGKRAPALDTAFRTETFQVEGCISRVWLVPEVRDGSCYFHGQAESPIMQGVVTLLCKFYNGHAPQEVVAVEPDFLDQSGILAQLTPTRRVGVSKIRDRIRRLASGVI